MILNKNLNLSRSNCLQSLFWLMALCLTLYSGVTQANTPSHHATTVDVTSHFTNLDLNPYLTLLEDTSTGLSFDDVRQSQDFHTLSGQSPNFGFTGSVWWAKFQVHNPLDRIQELMIRQDYPLIDYFDIWYSSDNGWQHYATGDRRVFDERPIANRTFLIPITLKPLETAEVYVRFQTQGSMNIGLHLHNNSDMIKWVGGEYFALGIYYGGFLVLIVYNLIMFLNVREKAFVYYLLYVLSYGLYMSVHNAISFEYLWPENTWIANQSLLIFLALSLYWAIRFTRSILVTARLAPLSDKIAAAMEWLSLGSLALTPFLPYHNLIVPMAILTMVICAHFMVMAVQTMLSGLMAARYYLSAFSALLIGVLAYMLKTFGLLPHNFLTQNAFQVGSLIEMVLLSLAIASRVNEIKHQTFVDTLTLLYNRRYMNNQLHMEMTKSIKTRHPLSLAVIDIDHFKKFNDFHGHAMGDKALQKVASILKDSVRKPAVPCRFGGEEFVVIMPETKLEDAHTLCERLRQNIEVQTANNLKLTASIGFASTEMDHFTDEDDLFKAADFALYQAKNLGRNQVQAYSRENDRRKELPIASVEKMSGQ